MRFVRPLLVATLTALAPAQALAQAWWSELRDGTGVGVGAPQFGPRRGLFLTLQKDFSF